MSPSAPETEARLLEAAGEVFAEHGFAAATVREICERAGANLAAVNYHYGDKLGLYRAVFRHAAMICGAHDTEDPAAAGASPAVRLRWWVRNFLADLAAKDAAGWPARLMSREIAAPSEALAEFIEQHGRRKFDALMAILAELAPGLDRASLMRCAASVAGQVIYYHHGRPFIERLAPGFALTPEAIDSIADHIARFSLAGIAARSAS